MILSKVRDPRLITIRRGGTLTDDDQRLRNALCWFVFDCLRV